MTTKALLYLHGFHSSPKSVKAMQMLDFMKQHHVDVPLFVPQLPVTPLAAAKVMCDIIEQNSHCEFGLVGSSMGGYMATYAVERFDNCRAVVVNPAVRPYELLQDYLGEQTHPYTGEVYDIGEQHIKELKTIDTPSISKPDRLWLMQQEGDEVLDYRQAVTKYQQCKTKLESGGDHSFVGFDRYLKSIVNFLELA